MSIAGVDGSDVATVSVEAEVAFLRDTQALDLVAGATNKGVQVTMLEKAAKRKNAKGQLSSLGNFDNMS